MKKIKKILSLLFAVSLLVLLPFNNSLTVSAAEPVTYSLKYLPEKGAWRYQVGSPWEDDKEHRDLYYLGELIQDGDYVVIYGGSGVLSTLDFAVRLGNLTTVAASEVVISASGGIEECYILENSTVAVNGNVNLAYVYNNACVTFNNNVTTMQAIGTKEFLVDVTCLGSAGHVTASNPEKTLFDIYNVAAGKLQIEDGQLKTDAAHYTTTAPAQAPASDETVSSETDITQDAQTDASANQTTSSDEYDDVPKTGESYIPYLLLGIAFVCLSGSRLLQKSHS